MRDERTRAHPFRATLSANRWSCSGVVVEGGAIETVPMGVAGVRIADAVNCGARNLRFSLKLIA